MKKLLKSAFYLALAALIALLTLTACGESNPTDNGGDDKNPPVTEIPEGALYGKGTTVRVIRSESGVQADVSELTAKLLEHTGKMPNTFLDTSEPTEHEIVIGDTSRPITGYAKDYVESLGLVTDDVAVFCIYAYRGSVAIWWSHELDVVANMAVERFIKSYMSDKGVELKDGPIYHETYDYAAAEKERETAKRESQLAAIEAKLGKEAAEAMRNYLTLFDEGFYIWLANLYDPETGALYYSNSGRDNEGFLPDIESTTRGFSWVQGCGMTERYENGLADALPDWLKEKLAAWLQGMQSPEDGFFYHPQWGKNITVSRKSRDLDNATSFLTRIGADILYDTTNGYKGTLGAPKPSAYMTTPLGRSAAAAVADVVAVDSAYPEYLRDTAKFREYILDLDWASKSYSAGNTLESQAYQIKAAGNEYVKVYEDTMNEIQEAVQAKLRAAGKPENGLWEDNVRYDSVNGLMKIGSTYTRLGIKMNYIEEAFASAFEMVVLEKSDHSGKSATNIVDIYNPWYCLRLLMENASNFGNPDTAATLRATLTARAAELIEITRRKVSIFRKDDGSYGYMAVGVPEKSQGALVAVKGTNEGDVNGGTIATTTVIGHMCAALGVSTPSLYFNSDFEKFMAIIESAKPIEKIPTPTVERVMSFDNLEVGTATYPPNVTAAMNTGSLGIISDPRGSGNVAEFVTKSGTNALVKIDVADVPGANCYVFEWQMNVTESKSNTTALQIRLGSCFMLTVHTENGYFTLGDSSSENGSYRVNNSYQGRYNYNEWHTVRVEYYPGSSETVRTDVYVNGTKAFTSNNYCGKVTNEKVEPTNSYTWARFFALMSPELTILFDNVLAEQAVIEEGK